MLYLTRKIGESIIINSNIEVKIMEVKHGAGGGTVKLGFEFPNDASVLRKEIFDKVAQENLEAALNGSGFGKEGITPDSQEDFMKALDEISKSMEEPAFTAHHTSKEGKKPAIVVKKKKFTKPAE
jgi:carbon storage regulator